MHYDERETMAPGMTSPPVPPDYRSTLRELERTRAELDALLATRTFRWTGAPRRLYRRLRGIEGQSTGSSTDKSSPYAPARVVHDPSECDFYHSVDLPHHGTIDGYWDLRAGIDSYLGQVDFSNKRILEVGPASGFVTMAMEQRGGKVVGVEFPDFASYDLLPVPGLVTEFLAAGAEAFERLKSSFWCVHSEFGLSAQVYYGSVYSLPEDVGDFDIALLGSVLLHSHDPIGMILSCAQRTRETLIVTDVRSVDAHAPDRQGAPVCVLVPSSDNKIIHTWWTFSPEFFVQLLRALGFEKTTVSFHEQRYVSAGGMRPMFTVVASRPERP